MSAKTTPVRRRKSEPLAETMDRQPPFDPQAEMGVLSSVVLLPQVLDDVALIVRPDDFYDDAHSRIYSAMLAIRDAGKPIDPTLLVDRLRTAGDLETIGGVAFLSRVVNAAPNAAHATYYAEIVRDASRLRNLIRHCTETLRQAYEQLPPDDVLVYLEGKLAAMGHASRHEARSIGDVAAEAIGEIEADASAPSWPGVMTGLDCLDQAKGPIFPGEVEVVAARPGNGKTAYGTQVAMHNAQHGRPALIVSLEMQATELAKRILCGRAGLDSRDVRSGRLHEGDMGRMLDVKQQLGGLPLRLWSPPVATLADIRGVARYHKANGGLQLLVIDYLGLVRSEPDDRRLSLYERVTKTSAGLKALARELDLPIIVLVQLNRESEKEEPRLSHLRDSCAIEQDADSVSFIHHPPTATQSSSGVGVYAVGVHLLIAKHRHGERGRVSLLWHPRETRFSSPNTF